MVELLVARHAFAFSNRDGLASCAVPGDGLTPEGVEQARLLAAEIAADEIALGVTSELARTLETLELALAGRNVPRVAAPELNEIDFGSFADGPLLDYRAWAAAHPPDVEAPGGGESRAAAAARFARGLRILLARPEDVVLVVWHALGVRYLLDAAQGLAPAALITPVEHAAAHRLDARAVESAGDLLEAWSREPHFRSE